MASIAVRHKSQTLIPKSHQSLINFSRFFSSDPPNLSSLDEIRKNLSQFQRKSSETPNPNPQLRNVFNKRNSFTSNPNPNPNKAADVLSFEKIKESLSKLKSDKGFNQGVFANQQLSFNNIKKSIEDSNNVSGNNNVAGKNFVGGLQKKLFEEEVKANKPGDESKYELFKTYSYAELGTKLNELRPNTEFSLKELQQRLGNLKEKEEKTASARKGALQLGSLRESLQKIKSATDGSSKGINLDILAPASLQLPPKDHLIEKYFHPDNMSSAEKLKLELIKMRDEFKISESDCGSTRVQIAQLTTEILHLSSVLHKKDKHSRRGLQLKVQKRKKLLKYLRRTDWDSYCFVLSKLGLRDNPDYKN